MSVGKIRVSVGSASKLGLNSILMDVEPTNLHLLTYNSDGCTANCAFCPQSQYTFKALKNIPNSQIFLSRVNWPVYDLDNVLGIIRSKFSKFGTKPNQFQRICLQSLNYDGFFDDVLYILKELRAVTSIPISLAIPPISNDQMVLLKKTGAERICFALDAATKKLFESIKGIKNNGPYRWEQHIRLLDDAVKIFGRGYVSTHLIIGFGESEKEALSLIAKMKKIGVLTGLFAFTPVKNTKFENKNRPNIVQFRKIQLGKYLLDTGKSTMQDFVFDNSGNILFFSLNEHDLHEIIDLGVAFHTSGCPGCNRPFYTSKPRGEQYNYPRSLSKLEKEKIFDILIIYCQKAK